MKKVAILTILDNLNLGTILQAYATARMIDKYGYRPVFINYFRPGSTTYCQVRNIIHDGRRSHLQRYTYAILVLILVSFVKKRLRSFLTNQFHFTRPYHSIDELRQAPPQANLYLTGSDQVWNTHYNGGIDSAFFLDFTNGPKVSYAASVGMTQFTTQDKNKIQRLLHSYNTLSVRESQTAEYFRQLGFSHTTHDLDPTLLLTAEQWKKAVNYHTHKRPKYLLVYSVEGPNNDFIFSQATILAREKNLKLYAVTVTDAWRLQKYACDKIFAFSNVKQFISLIADATFIVASSFHGTVFSIIFNKEFITIAPERFNIRMESLVKEFNLEHRIVTNNIIHSTDLIPIDYQYVNQKLTDSRITSENHLRTALSFCR